ncbi:hypothetical protein [Nocardia miyunensis]|uniref:hypothetical protein n=1 Tax=Nocardia miyunensis TaxID=282684 RepID=UPI0012F4AAA8|nr:hypothetical protein [Nocardia miyunensis]
MDGLQRRVLVALEHARDGMNAADARLLERRLVDLRAELDAADYGPALRSRLNGSWSEALTAVRWTLGRYSFGLH